jgi:hypothetical protein
MGPKGGLKMSLKYIFAIIGLSFVAVLIVLLTNLSPKAVPLIKPSEFNVPGELGKAISLRMREQIRTSPILFLGVMPEKQYHYQAWEEFLKAVDEPGLAYDVVARDAQLNPEWAQFANEVIDIKSNPQGLAAGLSAGLAQKKRVVVLVPSVYSSLTLNGNPAHMMKNDFKIGLTSMSLVNFARNLEEERQSEIPCMTVNDVGGIGPLGCVIQLQGRILSRKKLKSDMYQGAMSLVGEGDYLILFNPPKN